MTIQKAAPEFIMTVDEYVGLYPDNVADDPLHRESPAINGGTDVLNNGALATVALRTMPFGTLNRRMALR